jgi:hypothetical protein
MAVGAALAALDDAGLPAIGDVVTVAVRPEGPDRVGLWLA